MKDKQYNNADSFAIAFDEEWEKLIIQDDNLKITEVIKILSDHPFVESNPQLALDVANFRVKSLKKFK